MILLGLVRGLHLAGLFAAFGTTLFTAWFGRVPGSGRLASGGAILAFAAGIGWFALQTADFASPQNWRDELAALVIVAQDTRVGWILITRMIALAAAMLCYRLAWNRLAALMLAGTVLTESFIGHGAAMLGSVEGDTLFAGSLVHVAAAACWLGTLPALWLAFYRLPDGALGATVRAYSKLGTSCVLAILATAVLNYIWLIGGVAPLVSTAYGVTVLVKFLLLVGIIAFAARNKFRLTPALPVSRATLRRAVGAEALLGFLILLAAGLLMQQEPPAMMNMGH